MMQQPELKCTGANWRVDAQESKTLGKVLKINIFLAILERILAIGNATAQPGIVQILCKLSGYSQKLLGKRQVQAALSQPGKVWLSHSWWNFHEVWRLAILPVKPTFATIHSVSNRINNAYLVTDVYFLISFPISAAPSLLQELLLILYSL